MNECGPSVQVGPLSAFTEESLEIMRMAAREIDESKDLRIRSLVLMRDSIEMAKKNSKFVDETFARKISEQLNLTVNSKKKIEFFNFKK